MSDSQKGPPTNIEQASVKSQQIETHEDHQDHDQSTTHAHRPKWNNKFEFLMSCIATSVGLGNVWRFPFVAYQNGGGAFLIPYLIVLAFIGMPMYYLETVLGQFSCSNNVKIWACCPAMKGTGYAQALGATYVLTYYVAIIAICMYYLIVSFKNPLPWSKCDPTWRYCVNSGTMIPKTNGTIKFRSSAEFYFVESVLHRSNGIHKGIGAPLPLLTTALFVSWFIIFGIVSCGVRSSGKASYFLALFPYVILIILFVRTWFLTGAGAGIKFFFMPDWEKILQLKVWYAAVTQVFFSLSVCSGALIMFASYNGFTTNVYNVSIIVSILDTLTSMLSGMTIFAILGNLAHELGYEKIEDVVGSGGTSLAFVSYPDAISKAAGEDSWANNILAILFFLMMAVLGVGSGVALLSTLSTVLMDNYPHIKTVYVAAVACTGGFLAGLVYVTPGGQYVLELVDYYGGTFLRLFAAICEAIGIMWIYGLENLCVDIRFMLSKKPSAFWRICWAIVTPLIMILVFVYGVVATSALKYGGVYVYPPLAYYSGNLLQYTGMMLVPIFMIISIVKYKGENCKERTKKAFTKKGTFGPSDPALRSEWKWFTAQIKAKHPEPPKNKFVRFLTHSGRALLGLYDMPKYEVLKSESPQGLSKVQTQP